MSMRNRIKKSVTTANGQLAERELQLLLDSRFELERLSPAIKDHAQYQTLLAVIQAATSQNLSMAELEKNIRQLGEDTWLLAQDIIKAVR
ncbi:Hypothetical protein VIBNISFn27_1110041 [Vibrio nigripulchritudo SFn27]|uniref:Uncharacterized protein n=1 Tax=Vibrio nigripulchritudo TaxID=28173 RepID=U4K8R0_9VIBR|nr:hypothetical protein [Vibrio nigripulchritudo]CCN83298.1 Hypothetical protein VIBNIBLFn1_590041 [Vibrio nigripulchritudo BLFn1]CCN86808.1 Hypothetical protein VIBNISFn27_1110041 [Vibrio nigripulchritudo SFn27]CCN95375.1 Hypothetical protein VIBNIENn2_540006 [Vibrio nigripulchritudo ENn2]CCO41532.1 Hypothetical protein VIBNISFn135_540006 [Vibrio nigripulchritudo SFn135]CCO53507.1 Hypothetical protein VIBNIWn13_520005 [Vibrio nigripulchritudo Wn13]